MVARSTLALADIVSSPKKMKFLMLYGSPNDE